MLIPQAIVQTGTGAGALTQILDTTLGSAQASFDTNTILGGNIAQTYTCLLGQLQGRCDAGTVQQVRITFNNDAGPYDRQQLSGSTTVASAEQSLGDANARIGTIPGTDAPAGATGTIFMEFPNYNGTTFHKMGLSKCMLIYTGSPTYEIEVEGIRWRNTAAINRIILIVNGGSNFVTGTRFTLWGMT